MAGNLIDIDAIVPLSIYADLETVSPMAIMHGIPEADWNVNAFGSVQIWSSNVALVNDAQISSIGATWHQNITTGSISTRTAIRGLRLAMSLKSANNNSLSLISSQIRVPPLQIPDTDHFCDTPFTLRGSVATNRQSFCFLEEEDSETIKRNAYCFLAAYLMRLIVKGPQNVVNGIPNMKRRFEYFYGSSRLVEGFNMTLAQAYTYREALLNQSLVALTYTHALAYTHQNIYHELDAKEREVLCYLGFLPFSYTGMHAYTLMMELKTFTEEPLGILLSLFHLNITAPALHKIAQIVREYERTCAHPTRDLTFRYCTLWGPQYFASLRSKNCPHLVYIVAHAWKTLAAGHPNSDPERIVAVNVLSEAMKRALKTVGERFGEALKQRMRQRGKSL